MIERSTATGLCLSCLRGNVSAGAMESISGKDSNTCEVTQVVPERVRTLEDLIRICEIDTDIWKIERWVANKWEMGSVDKTKRPTTTALYQVKAWLRRKVVVIAAREEIQSLLAEAKKSVAALRPVRVIPPLLATGDYMLELDIFDLHAGKLAWSKETGHQNYDVKIAEAVFGRAVDALMARTAGYPISQIVFPIGNDLLNSDNELNTTTRGTPQDTDGRFQKTFLAVRRMMTDTIEKLRQRAPVIVYMVPGNHDKLSVWHLGDSLECFFARHKDVTVHNLPNTRKYHQFGDVMLMFTHGDKGKHPDYPLVMATEEPVMFGSTKFREAHIGHRHETKTREFHGVRVRTLSALCPPDAWHAEMQFVGNQQSAEAFVWSKKEGLVSQAFFTVAA